MHPGSRPFFHQEVGGPGLSAQFFFQNHGRALPPISDHDHFSLRPAAQSLFLDRPLRSRPGDPGTAAKITSCSGGSLCEPAATGVTQPAPPPGSPSLVHLLHLTQLDQLTANQWYQAASSSELAVIWRTSLRFAVIDVTPWICRRSALSRHHANCISIASWAPSIEGYALAQRRNSTPATVG